MKQKLLNSFKLRAIMLVALLCSAFMSAWAEDVVYKTALFGSTYNSQSVSSYENSWTATNDGFTVTLTNFNNNNNGWNYVKCGRKNNASVASITTAAAIDKAITQIDLTIDAITSKYVNSIKLYTSADGSTWTTAGTFGSSESGTKTLKPTSTANLFYKIEFDCASGTSNGIVTVSKVEYYTASGGDIPSDLEECDLTLTNAPVALSFDLYNNAAAQTISYTTSSTGAVTVSTSDYVTTSVNESAKTITVTPVAVTPNAQTITISQAADDTYAAGSQSFTVTIDDSTPLPTYTITLGDNNEELTEATGGAGVTLPTRDAIEDYAFAGWSITNVESETTDAPSIIPAGNYYPTADITLYPVYKMIGEESTPSAFSIGNTGSYAIVSEAQDGKYYALPTNPTVSNGKISAKEITVSEIGGVKFVTPTNADGFAWTIAAATNGYTLSDGSKYIYHSNGGASGTNLAYGTGTSYTWAFTADGDYIKMASMSGSTTNTRGLLFSGTTIGGYALSNWGATGYYKSMILPIAEGATTYYWSAPVAAAVERPAIEVAENPFFFSTTATITCETDGATIKYSYDGETWSDYTAALTITESTTIYAKAFKGNDESNVATVTATKKLATPTVTIAADNITNTNVFEGTAAGSLSASVTYEDAAVEGATVTWSGNNDAVATIDPSTGVVTLVAAGSVTFTATYAGNSDYSEKTATYEMTVTNIDPNAPGSENNPYSVTEAIDATPASGTSDNVYIHGIVSAFYKTSVMDDGKNYRYYISDDGTTTNQLLVYKGKGLNNVAFSNADDLQLGDEVVICGGLTIYNGTSEVAADNYIVSLTHKPSISLDPATAALFTYEQDGDLCDEQSFTVTGTNLTSDITVSVTGEFDLRPSDGGYGNSTLSLSSGDEFFVNMNYDLAKGNYEGTLTIASEGATTITIALTGTVTGYIAPAIAAAETAVNVNATENKGTISMTYTKIDMNNIDVEFYESDGTTTATYDWISASIDDDNNVAYTVEANTGEARTAYLKVFGTDSNGGDDYIYSELVTITQAEYVAPSTYTLASSITSGKHYIIVGVKDGTYKAMGGQNQNNRKAVEVAENDGTVTGDEEVCEFVIYGPDANGRYAIYDETLPGYLYAAGSGNNYLKTQESNNINGKWTISFGETLSIVADGSSNRNVMQYNSSSSLFSCYGSASQAAVNLYEKDNEATPTEIATISPAGFATFSSATALDFTDVTEVYAYIAKQNGDRIQFTRVQKVPAETGVLLRSAEGNAVSVDVPVLTGAADDVTGNIFVPVLTEISKLASTEGENSNYILSKEGNNVGFYLANDKKVAAGRAYIQVPTAEGVKDFALDFDTETAINGIVNTQSLNGNCYNLSGQRVNRAQKGIFIVNGKKVVK